MVAWRTAYLKCHYPVQFMAAILNSVKDNTTKVSAFIQYCRKHGIAVLPPNVNKSMSKFSVEEGKSIRYGLSAVRNVGVGAVQAILNGRKERPYKDLYDFAERVEIEAINKRVVESLIKSGAMDDFPGYRTQKLAMYESILDGEATRRKTMITGPALALWRRGAGSAALGAAEDPGDESKAAAAIRKRDDGRLHHRATRWTNIASGWKRCPARCRSCRNMPRTRNGKNSTA